MAVSPLTAQTQRTHKLYCTLCVCVFAGFLVCMKNICIFYMDVWVLAELEVQSWLSQTNKTKQRWKDIPHTHGNMHTHSSCGYVVLGWLSHKCVNTKARVALTTHVTEHVLATFHSLQSFSNVCVCERLMAKTFTEGELWLWQVNCRCMSPTLIVACKHQFFANLTHSCLFIHTWRDVEWTH